MSGDKLEPVKEMVKQGIRVKPFLMDGKPLLVDGVKPFLMDSINLIGIPSINKEIIDDYY